MGKKRVLTGCPNCSNCTGSRAGNAGRRMRSAGTTLSTGGLNKIVGRKCCICDHPMAFH